MYFINYSVKAIFPAAIPILWVADLICKKLSILSNKNDV